MNVTIAPHVQTSKAKAADTRHSVSAVNVKNGCCIIHPDITLRQKGFLGWTVLVKECPRCAEEHEVNMTAIKQTQEVMQKRIEDAKIKAEEYAKKLLEVQGNIEREVVAYRIRIQELEDENKRLVENIELLNKELVDCSRVNEEHTMELENTTSLIEGIKSEIKNVNGNKGPKLSNEKLLEKVQKNMNLMEDSTFATNFDVAKKEIVEEKVLATLKDLAATLREVEDIGVETDSELIDAIKKNIKKKCEVKKRGRKKKENTLRNDIQREMMLTRDPSFRHNFEMAWKELNEENEQNDEKEASSKSDDEL